jgi:hypothetical protein
MVGGIIGKGPGRCGLVPYLKGAGNVKIVRSDGSSGAGAGEPRRRLRASPSCSIK